MYTLKLTISGITCDACVKLINKKISRIVGVRNVEVAKNGETSVESQSEIKIADIANALSGTPYAVTN